MINFKRKIQKQSIWVWTKLALPAIGMVKRDAIYLIVFGVAINDARWWRPQQNWAVEIRPSYLCYVKTVAQVKHNLSFFFPIVALHLNGMAIYFGNCFNSILFDYMNDKCEIGSCMFFIGWSCWTTTDPVWNRHRKCEIATMTERFTMISISDGPVLPRQKMRYYQQKKNVQKKLFLIRKG